MTVELKGMNRSQERPASAFNGYIMLLVLLASAALAVWLISGGFPPRGAEKIEKLIYICLLYTSPSPRD